MAHTRFLINSYSNDLVLEQAVNSRLIIQSNWYQQRWGYRYKLTGDQNAKEYYSNDKRGYRISTTLGGANTGRGGDRLIFDDPHNIKDAAVRESEAARVFVINAYNQVMTTRKNNPNSARVIIMQRSHEDDLVGHIKSKETGSYVVLSLPMRYEANKKCFTIVNGFKDPREKEGELLCPGRFPEEAVIEVEEALGARQTAAQFQQNPTPAGGNIFLEDHFQFYTELPKKFSVIIGSWDLAFKGSADSSKVCGLAWGFLDGDSYLLDRETGLWGFLKTKDAMRRLKERVPQMTRIYIEDKANGPAIIDALRSEITGLLEFKVNEYGSKLARAHAVTYMFEAGNVYLPHPSKAAWVKQYIQNMCAFPFGKYSDDTDATTQALLVRKKLMPTLTKFAPIESLEQHAWQNVGSSY